MFHGSEPWNILKILIYKAVNIPHAIHVTYTPIYVCITILLHSTYIYMSVLSIENNAKPATSTPLPI